ncbi:hypothetical protein L3Y21_gp046 [Gordonia phage Rabbitrun]|uniref:Uncharacterized protein n=1 Tax=Gordonia phage Rabbitrun TaxID=2762280 RepID=A0A7G8LIL7_9CAUD|nr:hypothetical protein L3Y21_gp046 [Gordonia phage Rabbitrun]QNJ57089.1 hypothetical protein SEA_RABBITRUN_46 [Gordonia phage Rabbitrun]
MPESIRCGFGRGTNQAGMGLGAEAARFSECRWGFADQRWPVEAGSILVPLLNVQFFQLFPQI